MDMCTPNYPQHGKIEKLSCYVLLGHVLRAPPIDPMREVLFEAGTNLPRAAHTHTHTSGWQTESKLAIGNLHLVDCHNSFDINNRMHLYILAERAQAREPPLATKP